MLVTFEEIDGSGKSTLVRKIHQREDVKNTIKTKEPTDNKIGELLRRHLVTPEFSPQAELNLFIADHAEHLDKSVAPAIKSGEIVLCDRYIDSRCAYQASSFEHETDDPLRYIQQLHEPWTIIPDLTILLDIEPKTALERLNTEEKFETQNQLMVIRSNYLELSNRHPNRIKIINGNQKPEDVYNDAIQLIQNC